MGRGLNIQDDLATLERKKRHGIPGIGPLLAHMDVRRFHDLVEEANAQNHVTVTVYRQVRGEVGLRHRMESKEQHPVTGCGPSVVLADIARMLQGKKPLYFAEAVKRCGGELVGAFPNLRSNVGADFCAANLSGTSVAVADTIALSCRSTAPAATDAATTLPWNTSQTSDTAPVTNPNASSGELTYGGFTRAAGTYAHSVTGPASLTNTYTLSKTFTASAVATSIQVAGLFGGSAKASQGGTNVTNMLFLNTAFTATTMGSGDQLAITWTVTI